jgi:alkanesulfonate monooxygenase SsuD/methylene tetrahydromethanopterin reductase-like flavin-dependent oxidoreductase (luciferase family)
VHVGLNFELRNPPDTGRSTSHVYGFALEMCEEAEHLGAHSIWVSEHHLFDDGFLPQPLTFAAAIAARTMRVRVGTAVVIAPLYPAIQIAESAAVVDLVSDGRLDLGLGAGCRLAEHAAYGVDGDARVETADERVRELRSLWAEGRITPLPTQDPLPIWMGHRGPKGAYRTGLMGERLLSADGALAEPFLAGLAAGGHDVASARMAGAIPGWISDDPDRDWPTVRTHLAYQLDSDGRHMVHATGQPARGPVDPERMRADDLDGGLRGFVYGTPEQAATSIRAFTADAPVDVVFLAASVGAMPDGMVADHVHTICMELAPLLAEAPA